MLSCKVLKSAFKIDELAETPKDFEKYGPEMYKISLELESKNLGSQELYDEAKKGWGEKVRQK